jgi:hypothetical protein
MVQANPQPVDPMSHENTLAAGLVWRNNQNLATWVQKPKTENLIPAENPTSGKNTERNDFICSRWIKTENQESAISVLGGQLESGMEPTKNPHGKWTPCSRTKRPARRRIGSGAANKVPYLGSATEAGLDDTMTEIEVRAANLLCYESTQLA